MFLLQPGAILGHSQGQLQHPRLLPQYILFLIKLLYWFLILFQFFIVLKRCIDFDLLNLVSSSKNISKKYLHGHKIWHLPYLQFEISRLDRMRNSDIVDVMAMSQKSKIVIAYILSLVLTSKDMNDWLFIDV